MSGTKFSTICLLFCVVLLLVFSSSSQVSGSHQKITFYENENCTGHNETLTRSSDNITEFYRKAYSVNVVGVWEISVENNGDGGWIGVFKTSFWAKPPQGSCMNRRDMQAYDPERWVAYEIDIMERTEPADITTSEINFFTEENMKGVRYSATDDNPQLTPRPFMMQSFLQFSDSTWIAFSGLNFQGNKSCLCKSTLDDDFQYNSSVSILVASVKIDRMNECNC